MERWNRLSFRARRGRRPRHNHWDMNFKVEIAARSQPRMRQILPFLLGAPSLARENPGGFKFTFEDPDPRTIRRDTI